MEDHLEEGGMTPEEMQQMMQPMVEEILHNAGLEVRRVDVAPGVEITLLRFHTPAKVYTIKLDAGGVEKLVSELRGAPTPGILVARPGDVPGLTR